MKSTVTPTPPKFPEDFTVAHFLDRIGRNPAEVDGDDAKVGGLLRKAAHQPDVAALQPDLARPGLDPMDSSVGAMGPSLGGRASRGLARFLIIFCTGVAATLAWQSYGDAARGMIANSYPQLSWLAPQTAPLTQTASETPASAAAPSPELEQLKEMSSAFATMRQRVDQLAASQQQMADGIAKLTADQQQLLQKISAPPPRPAAAPARKPVPLPSSEPR